MMWPNAQSGKAVVLPNPTTDPVDELTRAELANQNFARQRAATTASSMPKFSPENVFQDDIPAFQERYNNLIDIGTQLSMSGVDLKDMRNPVVAEWNKKMVETQLLEKQSSEFAKTVGDRQKEYATNLNTKYESGWNEALAGQLQQRAQSPLGGRFQGDWIPQYEGVYDLNKGLEDKSKTYEQIVASTPYKEGMMYGVEKVTKYTEDQIKNMASDLMTDPRARRNMARELQNKPVAYQQQVADEAAKAGVDPVDYYAVEYARERKGGAKTERTASRIPVSELQHWQGQRTEKEASELWLKTFAAIAGGHQDVYSQLPAQYGADGRLLTPIENIANPISHTIGNLAYGNKGNKIKSWEKLPDGKIKLTYTTKEVRTQQDPYTEKTSAYTVDSEKQTVIEPGKFWTDVIIPTMHANLSATEAEKVIKNMRKLYEEKGGDVNGLEFDPTKILSTPAKTNFGFPAQGAGATQNTGKPQNPFGF